MAPRSPRRPAPAKARARTAAAPSHLELTIEDLGSGGDGIARWNDQLVFVPLTVPGDRVAVRLDGKRGDGWKASVVSVLTPGPDRVPAPCPAYGRCGGCSLQHLSDEAYRRWSEDSFATTLARAGFDDRSVIAPLRQIAPGERRRAAFAFYSARQGVSLGFNVRAGHQVIDLPSCPLLVPGLNAILAPLRRLLAQVTQPGSSGDVIATQTDNGIDLLIDAPARLDLFDRERLAAFADAEDIARLCWQQPGSRFTEPLAVRKAASVRFDTVDVTPAPGGFLQPSAAGEAVLVELVREALGDLRKPVADLFSGCGSFTFPLATRGAVHAVEGDSAAIEALRRAAGAARVDKISTEVRDLTHNPLCGSDLQRFAAVVFDPPRTGAAEQARALAQDGPPLVVAVSCNPATLARDGRLLADGGYQLVQVTPVDQFPWSAHLEAVAVFRRGGNGSATSGLFG